MKKRAITEILPTAHAVRAWLASTTLLSRTLAVSVILHALLLGTHFAFPDYSKSMRNKALDIILVNSRSAHQPNDAQALAQANQDGGGNTEEDRRAKTPLPPTAHQSAGAELQQMRRRVQELEARQQALLTQAKSQQHVAPREAGNVQPKAPAAVSGFDLAESARAMARQEGEVSRVMEEYNKRPRKTNIGTRTKEYRFARYIEDWRNRIERIGTLNYPTAARGKLYGSLVMTVAIDAVLQIYVDRSSGHRLLDDAARRIVQLAAPYAPFPPDIRADTDILEITRTWHFTQGDQISNK
jgi:periplasmic protein TonB